jgi:hypothetical protein
LALLVLNLQNQSAGRVKVKKWETAGVPNKTKAKLQRGGESGKKGEPVPHWLVCLSDKIKRI